MLHSSTLSFLKNLKKNNDRSWFEKNRSRYEDARADFDHLVQGLIRVHGKKDPTIADLEAKNCIFRIYRDVRFSKNKQPYKTGLGCSIDRDGRKSIYAGYYLRCEPGGKSVMGGGVWMPQPIEVKKIRQEIDYCWPEFSGIINSKKFVKAFGGLEDDEEIKLVREPKGYEKDNPAIETLKLKSWFATAPLSDADLTSPGLAPKILSHFVLLQPLLDFINRSIEP